MNLKEELAIADSRIDKELRIVKSVSVLRASSKNGRIYSEQALHRAVELINEGSVKVFADHSSEQLRSVRDLIGILKNGRLENGVVKADLHYLKDTADFIESLVDLGAQGIGLSISAFGETTMRNGTEYVEDLRGFSSVDFVSDTASTNSLFESESKSEPKKLDKLYREALGIAEPKKQQKRDLRYDEYYKALTSG